MSLAHLLDVEPPRWNGIPVVARRVTITVGRGRFPVPWYGDLIGTRRAAVEVKDPDDGRFFYLDDEDGRGWAKVTTGRGSPQIAHRELEPVDGSVVDR